MAEFKARKEEIRWDFERDLVRMQQLLEILRLQYNKYFAGARKDPPAREKAELDRLFSYYRNATLANLPQQFRFTSFANTFTLQNEQWGKFLRAKENGVVSDPRMFGALRKAQNELDALERESPEELRRQEAEAPKENVGEQAVNQGASKPAAKPPAAPAGPRQLFDEYILARQSNGEIAAIDPAAFERQIAAQRKQIMEKYQAKDVLFTIETKDGKVSVKAKVVK